MSRRFDELVGAGIPCFFYTDFKGERFHCFPLDELAVQDIEFSFNGPKPQGNRPHKPFHCPVSAMEYRKKFEIVQEHIRSGNTYLLNLTQPTPIESPYSLKEIYAMAHAPYKLRVREEFVCFSPEPFVSISNDTIHTYPMKGTIDGSIPGAKETILADPKETAEHTMIVDLLRNDLGIVARNIRVEKFRYITAIETGAKRLFQVSTHISGKLEKGWQANAGKIIRSLLPAGSISGTPKKMSVKIIEECENYTRGYFTGIFGFYDGNELRSAVSIRYIENTPDGLVYKSGGGITSDSEWEKEYAEMIDKIYIP